MAAFRWRRDIYLDEKQIFPRVGHNLAACAMLRLLFLWSQKLELASYSSTLARTVSLGRFGFRK